MTQRHQSVVIAAAKELAPAERIRLRRKIGRVGPISLDRIELIVLPSFSSPAFAQVAREIADLQRDFISLPTNEKEMSLLRELHEKRAEMRKLLELYPEAENKARCLVRELRSRKLLVEVGAGRVRPCASFPFPNDAMRSA